MAITYKERSTYVKKETIDGNEKIVVDGTQYITPDQIRNGLDKLYVCTYGTTTSMEVTSAVSAGKLPICWWNNRMYSYSGLSNGYHTFLCFTTLSNVITYYRLYLKDVWGNATLIVTKESDKVENIDSSCTHNQYPSAKAVYDAIHQYQAYVLSTLDNPISITLDSSAARTYQVCSITSRTSITLSIVKQNAGYEHYILFTNTGSSECALALPSGSIAPAATITVPAGKSVELSYIYNGSKVAFTASAVLSNI